MTYDVIVFDLDGTLSDPLIGIERSLNYALIEGNYPPLAIGGAAQFIGPQIDEVLSQITGLTAGEHLNALIAKYRERYADVGYSENTIYPGVLEALQGLASSRAALGVCTSKRSDFAEKILNLFGIRPLFNFVAGGDVGVHKWQQIQGLRGSGKVTGASIMIGDRAVDLTAAHRNSLSSGGVLWGYGSYAELSCENPSHLFESPSEWATLSGANQSTDPTLASGTTGAEHQPRHP
jgi:phosphoglycolate phosphatase